MQLESLVNELLLDLFKYFDAVDLLRAFYGLNSRFENLLFCRYQSFHLDLKSISKKDFDFICQQHLSKIIDRTISLHLSDDDDTPGQTDCFLSYGFILRQFSCLQSLSLLNIYSENAINKLLMELNYLEHLTYLKINTLAYRLENENIEHFFQTIFNLPYLTYFYLKNSMSSYNICLKTSEVISSSLQHFITVDKTFYLCELYSLFKSTSHLQHLRINIKRDSNFIPHPQISYVVLTLTVLKISFEGSFTEMRNLLENMPNLCRLNIETRKLDINGHHWNGIITNILLKLKIFQLRMQIDFRNNNNREEEVDELLNSFRTPFWLDERQWFVRCDWNSEMRSHCTDQDIVLYTLPYAFDTILQITSNCSKSTCPQDKNYWSYDCVHHFSFFTQGAFKYLSHWPIQLSNIEHLTLNFPFDNSIWSIFPRLDKLISLNLFGYEHNVQSQLQTLFDRTPYLYSLTVYNMYFTRLSLTSNSIRRLSFLWLDEPFDVDQCVELCRSSLFQQCEVLQINIRNRNSILDLIKELPNLRVLIVKCKDDKWKGENQISSFTSSKQKDVLMKWLNARLPSNYYITRAGYRLIRVWIGY